MTDVVDDTAWRAARRRLLDAEKAHQRARDELAASRRALPARRVSADYEFDSADGPLALGELFKNCSQLAVYHFMFHPDWQEGCKSCSFWADSYDGMLLHLAARDVAFAVVSRAPLAQLLAYRDRMQWSFDWYSSENSTFNYDFGVSFSPAQIESGDTEYNYRRGSVTIEELPGLSVFRKNRDASIDHTYSTYARGLDALNPVYQLLDLVPKGRDEAQLPYPMDWVRRHDEYQSG